MSDIKPIETHYKGYRFRSRLEARWAVFFDALGVPWEYEKEGYVLPELGRAYLADFWLPSIRLWVEIKGEFPKAAELQAAEELAIARDEPAAIFHGLPMQNAGMILCGDVGDSSGGYGWWPGIQWSVDRESGECCIDSGCDDASRTFSLPSLSKPFPPMKRSSLCRENPTSLTLAANRARAARFEHGEQG